MIVLSNRKIVTTGMISLIIIISCISTSVNAKTAFPFLEKMVAQSDYQKAWLQAKKLAKTYEGEPRFDYLYGISALETGHYDLAVFALDRVTVNQPNIIRPRLELARAYLKLKNDLAALNEFQEVLRLNPPEIVRRNVNRYIQAMHKPSGNKKWIINGLISLATGYDSNANFGAETSVFDTPVFGFVTLNDSSVKQDSSFTKLGTQLNARYINSDTKSWFFNTKLNHKKFNHAKEFDLSELSIEGGRLFRVGRKKYQFSLRNQFIHIDDTAFSHTLGVQLAIAYKLANNKQLSGRVLAENYHHKQQNLRDAHRYGVSGNYRFSVNNIHYQFGLSLGHERPKKKAGKQYTRNTIGVSHSVEHAWDTRNTSFIRTQFQYRKHRAINPIYAKKRNDKRFLFKIGHTIQLEKNWSVFANIGYTNNRSNLNIYNTNRAFAKMGINYIF